MREVSPVSGRRANGVAQRTGYAGPVRNFAAIAVMLAACRDPGLDQLTAIKTEVCACKTASCAEQALKRVPQGAIKQMTRAQEVSRAMIECDAKLIEAERPSTDPDAEDSAASPEAAPPAAAPAPAAPPSRAKPAAPAKQPAVPTK
jgi:hypothetical protein